MGKRFFLNVGLISNQMNCFRSAKIQELNYNSNRAPVSWVTGVGSGAGMFAYADIGLLNIGEDVEVIPEYWFYSATMKQEELIVTYNWGPYAFNSSNIEIERLELCGDFEHFYSRSNRNYGFVGGKYGTVVYDIPFATYDSDTFSTYGIFGSNAITDFEVSGRVSYIDNKILKNLSCTNCYVYAVLQRKNTLPRVFPAVTFRFVRICLFTIIVISNICLRQRHP
ncbi:MAG: hypothetical protein MR646_11790 [Agathobacter sp.]|nr:hypothetical protein [Agathobacter sp.]